MKMNLNSLKKFSQGGSDGILILVGIPLLGMAENVLRLGSLDFGELQKGITSIILSCLRKLCMREYLALGGRFWVKLFYLRTTDLLRR